MRPTNSQILQAGNSDSLASLLTGGRFNTTPLSGRKIYLDIKNWVTSIQTEAALKKLGAKVDVFIVDGVNFVITDRKEWTAGGNGGPREEQEYVPPKHQNSLMARSSNSGSVDAPEIGTKKLRLKSRAEEMLERVKCQPTQDTIDPLDIAVWKGIPILSLEKVQKWIHKINEFIQSKVSEKLLQTSSGTPSVSLLRTPFIKVEFETGTYQPLYKEIYRWPIFKIRGQGCPFSPEPTKQTNYRLSGPLRNQIIQEHLRAKHPTVSRVKSCSSKICKKSLPPITFSRIAEEARERNLSAETVKYTSKIIISVNDAGSDCSDFLNNKCCANSLYHTNSECHFALDGDNRKLKTDGGILKELCPNVPVATGTKLAVNLNLPFAHREIDSKCVPLNESSFEEKKNVPNEVTPFFICVPKNDWETEPSGNSANDYDEKKKPHRECEAGFGTGSCVLKRTHSDDFKYLDLKKRVRTDTNTVTETARKEHLEDSKTLNDVYVGWDRELKEKDKFHVLKCSHKYLSNQLETVQPEQGTDLSKLSSFVFCGENSTRPHSKPLDIKGTVADLHDHKEPCSVFADESEKGVELSSNFHIGLNANFLSEGSKALSVKETVTDEGGCETLKAVKFGAVTIVRSAVVEEVGSFKKPASVLSPVVKAASRQETTGLSKKYTQTSESQQKGTVQFIRTGSRKLEISLDQTNLKKGKREFTDSDGFKKPAQMQRMLSARRKRNNDFIKPVPGYCEICDLSYVSVKEHLREKLHKESFLNDRFLPDLDRVIADSSIGRFYEHLKISK